MSAPLRTCAEIGAALIRLGETLSPSRPPWYVIALKNLVRVGEYRRDTLWPAVLGTNLANAGLCFALNAIDHIRSRIEASERFVPTTPHWADVLSKNLVTAAREEERQRALYREHA